MTNLLSIFEAVRNTKILFQKIMNKKVFIFEKLVKH